MDRPTFAWDRPAYQLGTVGGERLLFKVPDSTYTCTSDHQGTVGSQRDDALPCFCSHPSGVLRCRRRSQGPLAEAIWRAQLDFEQHLHWRRTSLRRHGGPPACGTGSALGPNCRPHQTSYPFHAAPPLERPSLLPRVPVRAKGRGENEGRQRPIGGQRLRARANRARNPLNAFTASAARARSAQNT